MLDVRVGPVAAKGISRSACDGFPPTVDWRFFHFVEALATVSPQLSTGASSFL
jgi:hypothetical protein